MEVNIVYEITRPVFKAFYINNFKDLKNKLKSNNTEKCLNTFEK